MKFDIEVPQVISVKDYHDFRHIQKILHSIGLKSIQIEEITFFDQEYHGILYTEINSDYQKLKEELQKEERKEND